MPLRSHLPADAASAAAAAAFSRHMAVVAVVLVSAHSAVPSVEVPALSTSPANCAVLLLVGWHTAQGIFTEVCTSPGCPVGPTIITPPTPPTFANIRANSSRQATASGLVLLLSSLPLPLLALPPLLATGCWVRRDSAVDRARYASRTLMMDSPWPVVLAPLGRYQNADFNYKKGTKKLKS